MRIVPLTRFALTFPLVLAACTVGPNYVRPAVQVPPAFKEAGQWQAAQGAETRVQAKWWVAFGDPGLNGLEERVVVDNQTLHVAEAQYRAAKAALDSARAARYPTVTGAASATRGAAPTTSSVAISNTGSDTFSVSATASWEIDAWGRIRRTIEAAGANAQASAADLAAARLSIQALLAQTWFQLRASDTQLDTLSHTVDVDTRFLALTRDRFTAGVASALDVALAESQLGTARTQADDAALQHAQLEDAVAILVGKPLASIDLKPNGPVPTIPAAPRLLPSALVESRPDIVAAERSVAAANAQIGVAESAFYPSLDLAADGGFTHNSLAGLLSAPSRFWSLGPALAATLFDGGARAAAVNQAKAGYDQTVANYRQTVLTAFQEVEDNLAAARQLEQEADHQDMALKAAQRARDIAENEYRAGTASALDVITAETAEYAAELNAISIWNRRISAAVLLFKNAGGRWPPIDTEQGLVLKLDKELADSTPGKPAAAQKNKD